MAVSLRDARVHAADCAWIRSVYREYLEDLRTRGTGVFRALGAFGIAEPDQVQLWLTNRQSILLTILDDQRPAGFALVVRQPGSNASFRMTEFFIARGQRRRGFGRAAARLIFDRFAGDWEVVQDAANREAMGFWRNVLATYTRGDYRERTAHGEVRQYFNSARQGVSHADE